MGCPGENLQVAGIYRDRHRDSETDGFSARPARALRAERYGHLRA
jgi:hypothetical protein